MPRIAFRMKLFRGFEKEYETRHDKIEHELKDVLKKRGISDYSIFLDEETGDLFAILTIRDAKDLDNLSKDPAMKKWWAYMKDIMETNADQSPVTKALREVFYLP